MDPNSPPQSARSIARLKIEDVERRLRRLEVLEAELRREKEGLLEIKLFAEQILLAGRETSTLSIGNLIDVYSDKKKTRCGIGNNQAYVAYAISIIHGRATIKDIHEYLRIIEMIPFSAGKRGGKDHRLSKSQIFSALRCLAERRYVTCSETLSTLKKTPLSTYFVLTDQGKSQLDSVIQRGAVEKAVEG